MLRFLTFTTLALTGADHWTTYLCLNQPVVGWRVTEANPFADWLFQFAGLGPGLAIDSAITLAAVVFLVMTNIFGRSTKVALLAVITLTTGYAVLNNLGAISRMGLAPWSGLV